MTQIQKLKNYCVVLSAVFVIFFTTMPVFAAEITLDSDGQNISVGDQFEAGFFLNTENEDINAVEGKIVFPQDLLGLKEIKDGNSIINFWVERPQVSGNQIHFSGIVPGGYAGKKGLILSMIFQAQAEGAGIIEIRDVRALRNDGKGTPAGTTVSGLRFVVEGYAAAPKAPLEKKDIEPPEVFEPIISRNETMFEGGYFLVFTTQDKGLGIDYYEVCEGKRKCVKAENPYLLQNQDLDEEIIVKAVDKSSNERIAVMPPQKPKPCYKNYLYLAILIIGIVLVYFVWKILWKRKPRE